MFRNGRVLLATRTKPPYSGLFTLPGGHIEAGDDKTVTVTYANLSRAIGMRQKAMLSILQKMRDGGYVDQLREGRMSVPAVLRLTLKGEAALTRWREAA